MTETQEERDALYKGKFFYKVVKEADHVKLLGPFDNIYYVTERAKKGEPTLTGEVYEGYSFVEVDRATATLTCAFKENEILVTNRLL